MKKNRCVLVFSILVLAVAIFFALYALKDKNTTDKEKAISDFLEIVGYKEADFDTENIMANPKIVKDIEGMIGVNLKSVELTNIHAETSLDDNLSAKGYIQLQHIEEFMRQFIEAEGEAIYDKHIDEEIFTFTFGFNHLKWWNPKQTELSRTVDIAYLSNCLRIMITPVSNEKAEVYLFWFEM